MPHPHEDFCLKIKNSKVHPILPASAVLCLNIVDNEVKAVREDIMHSSLAAQPPDQLEVILGAAKTAGITIVSLPLVNQWTQVSTDSAGLCCKHY